MLFYPGQRSTMQERVELSKLFIDRDEYFKYIYSKLLLLLHQLCLQKQEGKLDEENVEVLLFLVNIIKSYTYNPILKGILEKLNDFYYNKKSGTDNINDLEKKFRNQVIQDLYELVKNKKYISFFDELFEIILHRDRKIGMIGEIAVCKGLEDILAAGNTYTVRIGNCEEDKRGGDIIISINTKKGEKVIYLDVKFVYSRRDGSIEDLIVISYNPSNCVGDGKGFYNMQLKIKYQSGLNEYIDFKSFGAGEKLKKILEVFKLVLKYLDTNIDDDNLVTSISNVIKGKVTIGRENERDRGFSIIIEC